MDFIYRTEFEVVKILFWQVSCKFFIDFHRGLRGPYGKGLVGHCTSGHSLNPPLRPSFTAANQVVTHDADHDQPEMRRVAWSTCCRSVSRP